MAEVAYKADINDLYAKVKADFTHNLAISGANLKLTRQLHTGNPLAPSGEPIACGTISKSELQLWLGKGAANGLAELDANGLVPSSQLPSYVDDVLEYASKSAFPATGTAGKIYVALDTNLTYRWSGSAYVEISPSLALGETSSTAYRGDRGKTAYDHATDASRLTTAKLSGFYKFATTAEGHIASVTAVAASDLNSIYGFTISGTASQTYNLATIASNASNGNTAYGWGNHANAGYALAADLGTASTHDHGDYVTAIGTSDNTLTWSKGGTAQTAITIPYATKAGQLETARTIWGQSFNGTANVTGAMTGVTNIDTLAYFDTSGRNVNIGTSGAPANLQVFGGVAAFGIANMAMNAGGGQGTVTGVKIGNGSVIPPVNGVITLPIATNNADGAMSYADKLKLDSIALYPGDNNSWAMTVGTNTITQGRIGTEYINALS